MVGELFQSFGLQQHHLRPARRVDVGRPLLRQRFQDDVARDLKLDMDPCQVDEVAVREQAA